MSLSTPVSLQPELPLPALNDRSRTGNAFDVARRALPAPVEVVKLRRINSTFAYGAVRIPGVCLNGTAVTDRGGGKLEISYPATVDKNGTAWPTYSLQPGAREAVEAAIVTVWNRERGQ